MKNWILFDKKHKVHILLLCMDTHKTQAYPWLFISKTVENCMGKKNLPKLFSHYEFLTLSKFRCIVFNVNLSILPTKPRY